MPSSLFTTQTPAIPNASVGTAYELGMKFYGLGHESANTTHRYVEADLAMKEKPLARSDEPKTRMRRYRPGDELLKFLQQL